MSKEQIMSELMAYLAESNPIVQSGHEVPKDQSLYELGLLDSFGVVEMVAFVEKHWDIKINNKDLTKERFGGLNKMVNVISEYLEQKKLSA